jgi:hypothetical protein
MHIGLLGFIIFAAYYVILKAVIQLINIEARRTGSHVLAGTAGLFA